MGVFVSVKSEYSAPNIVGRLLLTFYRADTDVRFWDFTDFDVFLVFRRTCFQFGRFWIRLNGNMRPIDEHVRAIRGNVGGMNVRAKQ